MGLSMQYDDDYPTCVKTHSALRIFASEVTPEYVSKLLGMTPSSSFVKGEVFSTRQLKRKSNGWIYSTESEIASKDSRRHLDLILSHLDSKEHALDELRNKGAGLDICCFWLSTGQGGPVISPVQMTRLAKLGLDVWWDVYFDSASSKQ